MSATVTQWFGGTIKPFQVGCYEINRSDTIDRRYAIWNGKYWESMYPSPQQCAANSEFSYPSWIGQFNQWRGLFSQPDTEKK